MCQPTQSIKDHLIIGPESWMIGVVFTGIGSGVSAILSLMGIVGFSMLKGVARDGCIIVIGDNVQSL